MPNDQSPLAKLSLSLARTNDGAEGLLVFRDQLPEDLKKRFDDAFEPLLHGLVGLHDAIKTYHRLVFDIQQQVALLVLDPSEEGSEFPPPPTRIH